LFLNRVSFTGEKTSSETSRVNPLAPKVFFSLLSLLSQPFKKKKEKEIFQIERRNCYFSKKIVEAKLIKLFSLSKKSF